MGTYAGWTVALLGPAAAVFRSRSPLNIINAVAAVAILGASFVNSQPAAAAYTQQQAFLFGSGAVGSARQGTGVALSSDGNIAAVGARQDNGGIGAVWIYTRSGGAWSQVGTKLVGSGATGPSGQGASVGLSADGNTLVVGGPDDNSSVGAVWVFTQSGGVWTQQGPKLVGVGGMAGGAIQGWSVAVSADGNTLISGAPLFSGGVGGAWVFTRTGGVWSQQGSRFTSDDWGGGSFAGNSVALSADGNTAALGGPQYPGGVWVFTRSGGVWTQQSPRLRVGTPSTNDSSQGTAVGLSGDGNTLIETGTFQAFIFTRSAGVWSQGNQIVPIKRAVHGGVGASAAMSGDGNTLILGGGGASSIFTQSGGVWRQIGSEIVGTGATGNSCQGASVAISNDSSTAIVGGPCNNSNAGAAWVFTVGLSGGRPPVHDFNADGKGDILWRNNFGDTTIWLLNGGSISQAVSLGNVPTAWTVVGTGDFNGDGTSDILWRDSSGNAALWLMSGGSILKGVSLGNVDPAWSVVGIGDFNGDGTSDILWRNTAGDVAIWFISGGQVTSGVSLGNVPTAWTVAGIGDFNGDGVSDILWRNTGGDATIWFGLFTGGHVTGTTSLGNVPTTWSVAGTGDFDADRVSDILWRDSAGNTTIWLMFAGSVAQGKSLGNIPTAWFVTETGDFDGDGASDILWRDTAGDTTIWFIVDGSLWKAASFGTIDPAWSIQGANSD